MLGGHVSDGAAFGEDEAAVAIPAQEQVGVLNVAVNEPPHMGVVEGDGRLPDPGDDPGGASGPFRVRRPFNLPPSCTGSYIRGVPPRWR